jgi:hypothetical protein
MRKEKVRFSENVVAVLKKEKRDTLMNIIGVLTGKSGKKRVVRASNIVTTAGQIYYAQMGVGDAPTNSFIECVLGTGTIAANKSNDYSSMTPIVGANKEKNIGYPKVDDDDLDNTGAGSDVMTWTFQFGMADFTSTAIAEGCITVAGPVSDSPLLTRWVWGTPFAKDANTSLKIIVNHAVSGV